MLLHRTTDIQYSILLETHTQTHTRTTTHTYADSPARRTCNISHAPYLQHIEMAKEMVKCYPHHIRTLKLQKRKKNNETNRTDKKDWLCLCPSAILYDWTTERPSIHMSVGTYIERVEMMSSGAGIRDKGPKWWELGCATESAITTMGDDHDECGDACIFRQTHDHIHANTYIHISILTRPSAFY